MMKTSGYRISPTEVEEVLCPARLVGERAAFGVGQPPLGRAIPVIASVHNCTAALDTDVLLDQCHLHMPAYMVPAGFEPIPRPLPLDPNGAINRKLLSTGSLECRLQD